MNKARGNHWLRRLPVLMVILALLGSFFIQNTQLVKAESLSEEDRNALSGWPNWVSGRAVQACGTALVGSENAEKIYNYFIGKGLTPPQAAGIMGNLQAESGMNPKRVQGTPTPSGDRDTMTTNGRTGYGIAQWTSLGRQQALHKAATDAGKLDGDLGVQLDYLWKELEESYKADVLEPIRSSSDIKQVTSIFMIKFERPADQSQRAQNERANLSLALLTKYGSNSPSTTNPAEPTSVNVCGEYSLPVDKKWYDEHKNWFTQPHHDYPAADIPVPTGTEIFSMTAGKVIQAPVGGGCGQGVIIDTDDGVRFTYCHGTDGGSVPGAKKGDTVTPGQLIMHSGYTGHVIPPGPGGAHLHVDIRINEAKYCPQKLFVGIVEGSIPEIRTLPTSGCTN